MDRRELLRGGAATGFVGLAGVVAYRQFVDQPPDDGQVSNGTPTSRPRTETTTEEEPTTTQSNTTTDQGDLSPPSEVQPVSHGDEFGTVIDAIRAGADPDGKEPIDGVLEQYADDDTLLSFRPGTYLLPPIELTGYDHLGIAAAGDKNPTFVAPEGSCIDTQPYIKFDRVADFLFEGFDFDYRRRGAGGAVLVIASGDATVRDVTAQGSCHRQTGMFRIDIRNPEGTGLVERLRLRDIEYSGWVTGAYVGKHHSGTVTFRDCEITEFTDNGLYASSPGLADGGGGTVHTVGGHFENNNVANIRLGSVGSTARGATIVVESAPDAARVNLRGIRLRRGRDQLVKDCDIRYGPAATDSFGAIVFHPDNGGAQVVDTSVTMESDGVSAVKAFNYSGGPGGGPTFENLTVDGNANQGYAMQINGRNGTTFRNCTVEQPGDRRDGLRIAYSDDCELLDSRIDVTGYPLILRDTTLTIRNTTFVTPDGERHIDHMEAGPGDFRPETWD